MTERVEPMGEMDIEYLVAVVRDHARLVADLEAHRSLSRNQIEQWQHERDALRAELARIRAHIESSHNEVTCSQDARHTNEGGDRVPMLTCMTLEAHTLRAENAKLRERVEKLERLYREAKHCAGEIGCDDFHAALAACEEGSK